MNVAVTGPSDTRMSPKSCTVLVQLDYSAERVVLAGALGGDDTAGGHKQKHRGGNMLEYIHKSRCLIV